MAIKSAWAYRNGKRMDGENNVFISKLKDDKKAKHEAGLPEKLKKIELTRKARQLKYDAIFDALEIGDTLAVFNMPHILIKKKNRKSVITSDGGKLTKADIFGAI
jgi:hypothetical protein